MRNKHGGRKPDRTFASIVAASPQYLFFGGKGGTGKTTCAAAAAIAAAQRGRRALVVSTDPAHSLGDILGQTLTARPVQVPLQRRSLNACELDADRALARWLTERRPALVAILQRGTILERRDIDSFLSLSLPGVDELLGLLEITRLAADGAYDQVIVDTAPTGHTLRLLSTPALFATYARVLDVMQEKHRVLASTFGHGATGNGSEALIEELRHDGERLGALLRDRTRTRVCWVTLPEEMSVAESDRAMTALRTDRIHVSDIVVNRLTPAPPSACVLCDGRRRSEARWVKAISERWRGVNDTRLWALAARERPPQGIGGLRAVARSLSPLERQRIRSPERQSAHAVPAKPYQALPTAFRTLPSTRLLIVGGKGGVGKTTCAAALALAAARETPDHRVLLVSTDPAHSLGDVIGQRIGDVERRIRRTPANLVAREIDAVAEWRTRREQYRESIRSVFEELRGTSHADLTVDRAIVEELIELAPPGIDEVVSMMMIIGAVLPGVEAPARPDATPAVRRFDLVIVDSAPTGHTLRLLELPTQARAWVRQLMTVVLKYKISGFDRLASELLWLSRGLRGFQALLTNPRACGFIVVTRPEYLAALETLRLLEWLQGHHISRRTLIVNGVTPPACTRCQRIAARERRQLGDSTSRPAWKRAHCPIVLAAAIAPPPRGVAALSGWRQTWRAYSESDDTAARVP